jgi:hypothetical protein
VIETVFLNSVDLVISNDEIVRFAGGQGYTPSNAIQSLVKLMSRKVMDLVIPAHTYSICESGEVVGTLESIFNSSSSPCLRPVNLSDLWSVITQ